ncbi:MAG: amino acid ABC transporter permease [Lactobacillales bacterium]|jgi:putative glutamine transport system permease protein|nr:amino acid ABC transporter permease [Lactobacillales bacterium]
MMYAIFLLKGLAVTISVALIAIVLSFIIGSVLGVIRYYKIPVLSRVIGFVIDVIRNLPLLLIIFFSYFAIPQFTGIRMTAFGAAILALTIFESAMLSEVIRAGLVAVPKGQMEAGLSTGLSRIETVRIIIVPQAYKMMIPAIVSQFISLIKDTSLAIIISLPDFMHQAQIIYGENSNYVIPMFVVLAVGYFIVCYALSLLSRNLERRLDTSKARL